MRYLLVGKVRWAKTPGSPGRIQVTPELIEAESAADKWSAPYDTTLTDVFRVQGAIATQVAQALGLALSSQTRQKLDAQPTQNLAAYDAFLRGEAIRTQSLSNPVTANRAAAEYERAIAIDSGFALAWARLAQARALQYFVKGQVDSSEADAARRASARATTLAPDLPETWLAKRRYYAGFRGVHERAWLLTIVRNCCYTWRCAQRAEQPSVEYDDDEHGGQESAQCTADARVLEESDRSALRIALEQLPRELREALVLRELDGMSYKEIARVVGVPLGTIMSRLARARDQLQRILKMSA